jgi:hypothetical protein
MPRCAGTSTTPEIAFVALFLQKILVDQLQVGGTRRPCSPPPQTTYPAPGYDASPKGRNARTIFSDDFEPGDDFETLMENLFMGFDVKNFDPGLGSACSGASALSLRLRRSVTKVLCSSCNNSHSTSRLSRSACNFCDCIKKLPVDVPGVNHTDPGAQHGAGQQRDQQKLAFHPSRSATRNKALRARGLTAISVGIRAHRSADEPQGHSLWRARHRQIQRAVPSLAPARA